VTAPRVLVMGIGNVLLGDEGVGVHAVRRLERRTWPACVTVVDGGTGGFHLLSHVSECDAMVLIDASLDGKPPGTISVIAPKYASDYPRALSAHDIGLKDLVESAALLGMAPDVRLVTVSVADLQPMRVTLTRDIDACLPVIEDTVRALVDELLALPPPAMMTSS
jgi:hydrogenase maturation protease